MQDNNSNIKVLADIFLFLKKYFVLLIIFLILGIAWGLYKNINYSKKYKSNIIFSSGIIDNIVASDMINSLRPYLKNNNYTLFAEKINVQKQIVETIIDISAETYKEYPNKTFIVKMKLNNETYFDTIANALTKYLNNNEYCDKNFEAYKLQRTEVIAIIDSIINNNKEKISENYAILFDKKVKYQQDLESMHNINIIDKYIYCSDDEKSDKPKNFIIYSLGSLSIGLIISLIIESIKKLIIFLSKKS